MTSVGEAYRTNLVNRIKKGVDENQNIFLVSYDSLNGHQLSEMRKNLKQAGANMLLSKNKISKIALKEIEHEQLADTVEGPTAFVWSNADSVEVSKILVNLTKDFETVRVRGGILEDTVLAEAEVKKLSELPSRDVLRAQLLGTIIAPLTRLAGALNAKSKDLLSILKQYSEKKGGS